MKKKNNYSIKFRFTEFLLILLILISGILLAFSSGRFVLNFKQIGFSVISSVEKGVYYVNNSIKNTFNAVKELKQLQQDYNELVIKLENYEQMQRTNAEIRKENERLKEQLDFSISMVEQNIPAQIISRNFDNINSYLTINKGSMNGIKKNMPVVAFQQGSQGLVGKVVQVGLFTSQISPVYSTNNIVSARIQNTRDLGLVNGLGDSEQPLIMQYIRKRVVDELNYGDIIVTSGENDNYMRDVPVGTISKITVLDYNSSLKIELKPIIDFSKLETVFVVNKRELNSREKAD